MHLTKVECFGDYVYDINEANLTTKEWRFTPEFFTMNGEKMPSKSGVFTTRFAREGPRGSENL